MKNSWAMTQGLKHPRTILNHRPIEFPGYKTLANSPSRQFNIQTERRHFPFACTSNEHTNTPTHPRGCKGAIGRLVPRAW